jgi:hypothetical protein
MRGSVVASCVGLAVGLVGLLGLGALATGCEATKAPRGEPPAAALAGQDGSVAALGEVVAKPAVREALPTPTSTPTMVAEVPKVPSPHDREAPALATPEGADFSLEAVFPDRHLPVQEFSEKIAKRIRYKLRGVAKAPIALRSFIQVPNADGTTEVFALYEYSAYEECVRGYPTRKEGRPRCMTDKKDLECVKLGAVRAHFGVPKAGATLETGGALTVWSMAMSSAECTVSEERVFVDDLDRDGKLEMAIDVTMATQTPGFRSPDLHEGDRDFVIFTGTDDGIDLELDLDSWRLWGSATPEAELSATIEMRDVNGDGRLDVVQTDSPGCAAELYDEYGGRREPQEGQRCVDQPRLRTVHLYEPRRDAWSSSDELSGMTRPAAAEDAEAAEAEAADGDAAGEAKAGVAPAAVPSEAPKAEGAKSEGAKPEAAKAEGAKAEGAQPEGTKIEAVKPEGAKPGAAKLEATKDDAARPEGAKIEAPPTPTPAGAPAPVAAPAPVVAPAAAPAKK